MEEMTQAAEPVSIESRIGNYLESAEEPPEPETDETAAPPEAEQEETTEEPATTEETSEVEPEYFEFVHNGETKKLPKDEALALARQGFDYTQKTQTLAEQRKAFESQVQQAQQSFALQNQQIDAVAELKALDSRLAQYKEVNWIQLAEAEPVEYLKLNQGYRDLKEARDAKMQELQTAVSQQQQMQEQQAKERFAEQQRILESSMPEFRGEKATESRKLLKEFLQKSGLKDHEIAGISDARVVQLAWKAMKYDSLTSKKVEADKKTQNLPKVVKPGVSRPQAQQQAEQQREARSQLKKTGKIPPGLLSRFI